MAVLMKNKNLSPQEAMDETAVLYKALTDVIVSHKDKVKSFGPDVDANVRTYIYGLEQWIHGHAAWYMETKRYFGDGVEEMARTRRVQVKKRDSLA